MRVKKVTLSDLEATYCCMTELPPDASWAKALPESREWFKANWANAFVAFAVKG